MEPKTKTSAGMETPSETVARIKAQLAANSTTTTPPSKPESGPNDLITLLTERLTKQGQGISSSASTNLQNSINEAIASTQKAGELSSAALQSEREREVSFAQDRASSTIAGTLDKQSGYAQQIAGLKELTATTEKSVRDLDKRYQEAIMANDSLTASKIADLKLKKEEFLMQQEQNFYQNLFSAANLQESALSRIQQNEQFWIKKQQEEDQFIQTLSQSKFEFEQNYALQLKEYGLKESQLEIDRARLSLSQKEYADRKKELLSQKEMTQTRAVIANDIKNKMASGQFKKEQFLDTNYLSVVKDLTGFDGTTEQLSTVILQAYSDVTASGAFNPPAETPAPAPTAFQQDISSLSDLISGSISSTDIFKYFTQPR